MFVRVCIVFVSLTVFSSASSSTAAESRRCTCQINALRPSSHPGNRRP